MAPHKSIRSRSNPAPAPVNGDTGQEEKVKAGHNGPDDAACRALLESVQMHKRDWDKAQEVAKSKQAEYRASIKRAKNAGMNADAISDAMKFANQEPEELSVRMKQAARYARLMGLEIGAQMGLFDEDDSAKPSELAMAYGKGFDAGRIGKGSIDDNPYNALSNKPEDRARAEAWDEGWASGQAKLGGAMYGTDGKAQPAHA
jgi:hypothetical protein